MSFAAHPFDLRQHTHLLTVSGSRAHGLSGPRSDVDLKGVAIAPAWRLLGILPTFEQADDTEAMAVFLGDLSEEEAQVAQATKVEGSVYALDKFARLCADANPNLLEVLFCRDNELRRCSPLGAELRAHRRLFLSQKAAFTFTGYALAQLKRIQGHRQWLLNPPAAPPTRAAFGLPERTLLPRDQLLAVDAAVQKRLDEWQPDWGPLPASEIQRLEGRIAAFLGEVMSTTDTLWHHAARSIGLDDNLIEATDRERRYRASQRAWEQYRTWQRLRNPARAVLEAKFGYDTKHGAHLVRLLRMGREIVETGEVHVWRRDRDGDELMAIRNGAWSYEVLVDHAEQEAERLRRVAHSPLPMAPDIDAVNKLVVGLVETSLRS